MFNFKNAFALFNCFNVKIFDFVFSNEVEDSEPDIFRDSRDNFISQKLFEFPTSSDVKDIFVSFVIEQIEIVNIFIK